MRPVTIAIVFFFYTFWEHTCCWVSCSSALRHPLACLLARPPQLKKVWEGNSLDVIAIIQV